MTVTNEIGTAVGSTMLKEPARNSVSRGSTQEVRATVEAVIADIRERGDAAVREYSEKFDKYAPESFLLSQEQLDEIMAGCRNRRLRTSSLFRNRSASWRRSSVSP
jgi:sulfopropanediol 3-dehydrogenase